MFLIQAKRNGNWETIDTAKTVTEARKKHQEHRARLGTEWVRFTPETSQEIENDGIKIRVPGCLAGSCTAFTNMEDCKRCGFNRDEDARRKTIPLTMGPDGLRRKYVGVRTGKTEGA